MDIEVKISTYEVNDEEDYSKEVIIRSHWNWDDRVIIEFEGKKVTVITAQLEKAINKCSNWRR